MDDYTQRKADGRVRRARVRKYRSVPLTKELPSAKAGSVNELREWLWICRHHPDARDDAAFVAWVTMLWNELRPRRAPSVHDCRRADLRRDTRDALRDFVNDDG